MSHSMSYSSSYYDLNVIVYNELFKQFLQRVLFCDVPLTEIVMNIVWVKCLKIVR